MTDTPPPGAVDLPPDAATWIAAYNEAKRAEAYWADVAQKAREHLEELLGDAEEGRIGGRPVLRWSYVTSNRLDTTKLKAERPDVYAAFVRPGMTRRFTIPDGAA